MKCPFCAEEIKDEAIVCRYCHTNLAEEQAHAVAEHRASAEDAIECEGVCRSIQARIAFSWSFAIAGAAFGLWLGASNAIQIVGALYLPQADAEASARIPDYVFKANEILTKHTLIYSGICAYIGWSMFWGSIIVRPVIRRFAASLFVFGNGLIDLLLRVIGIWLFCELILIPLVGTVVGGLGGGLYMLGKHMKLRMAYNSRIAPAKAPTRVTAPV